jgi:hypothetical protein
MLHSHRSHSPALAGETSQSRRVAPVTESTFIQMKICVLVLKFEQKNGWKSDTCFNEATNYTRPAGFMVPAKNG